jgi:hypothetical protein
MSSSFAPVKETDIQREIILYLRMKKCFVVRLNNLGVFDPKRQAFRASPNTTPGVSDLLLVDDGHAVFIEVKSAKGIQSENQKIFQQNAEKSGARYILARSVNDIIAAGF